MSRHNSRKRAKDSISIDMPSRVSHTTIIRPRSIVSTDLDHIAASDLVGRRPANFRKEGRLVRSRCRDSRVESRFPIGRLIRITMIHSWSCDSFPMPTTSSEEAQGSWNFRELLNTTKRISFSPFQFSIGRQQSWAL